MFIMIDGIDGSGKSTIIKIWKEMLQEKYKCFDITAFSKEHHRLPTLEEIEDAKIVFSGEPTHVWVGAAIRYELIQKNRPYTNQTIAEAFSLDREILYTRLLIPLREKGIHIIQDRGVSTSLCYQSLGKEKLSLETIANLKGNALTLKHAPDHLVICDLDIETAISRLSDRSEKDDNATFEQHEFLTSARNQFLSKDYQSYFTNRSTNIHVLNTGIKIDIMNTNAREFLAQHLNI